MRYDDELERSMARRRKTRTNMSAASRNTGNLDRWSSMAEPGSRADRKRNPGGNRKRKKNSSKWKKIALIIGLAVVLLIAGVAFAAYRYISRGLNNADRHEFDTKDVENENLTLEMKEKMDKGYWTIAVFGLDSRDSSTGKGNQSDVIMIVNVNRETGEIKLVSVFRDTYLNINDKNTYNKINAAYAQGGPEQAVKALNKNLDLNITHYAAFNWKAVATAINILGGVDIEISKSEYYYINAFITETVKGTGIGSTQLSGPGLHHMDGVQAVAYGRLRLMDSDYARTERQRIVIQKAFEKAKKADLKTLSDLLGNMWEMCATNIKFDDLAAMIPNITKYHLGESMGFPAARGEQIIRKMDCVIPQTLISNVTSLHVFLFDEEDYTPTAMVQTISKKISDDSGLYKAGKEIDHVPTDQGYIPKATKAAATSAAETKESKSSEEETDEDGSLASSTSDSEESSSGGRPGESAPTDSYGNPMIPGGPAGESTAPPSTAYWEPTTSARPSSPADMVPGTTERFGPGFEEDPEEAIMYPGQTSPQSRPTAPSESLPSSIIVPTTPAAPTTSAAPSSPADVMPGNGNGGGPGGQQPGGASGPASGM